MSSEWRSEWKNIRIVLCFSFCHRRRKHRFKVVNTCEASALQGMRAFAFHWFSMLQTISIVVLWIDERKDLIRRLLVARGSSDDSSTVARGRLCPPFSWEVHPIYSRRKTQWILMWAVAKWTKQRWRKEVFIIICRLPSPGNHSDDLLQWRISYAQKDSISLKTTLDSKTQLLFKSFLLMRLVGKIHRIRVNSTTDKKNFISSPCVVGSRNRFNLDHFHIALTMNDILMIYRRHGDDVIHWRCSGCACVNVALKLDVIMRVFIELIKINAFHFTFRTDA